MWSADDLGSFQSIKAIIGELFRLVAATSVGSERTLEEVTETVPVHLMLLQDHATASSGDVGEGSLLTIVGADAIAQANFLVRTILGAQRMVASLGFWVMWIPISRSLAYVAC